jgi:DNA repair exonuclease SbcCD ATPase subunit
VQRNPQLLREVAQAAEDIQSFQMEHNKILAISIREDLRDPEILKLTESHLTDELQNLEQELASLEQHRRGLNNQIDAIPRLQDEIDQLQETKQNDVSNSATLDQTISFLEQARESLSIKYMGTVQHKFISYMNRISGEDRDRIFVTPELEVTIERLGEPRSLDYFSAGQTDIVTLCMRLALVDALFKDTSSFIILDDPFVNLDDHNMKQALGVLQELAQDHQIVYLVCNSSRTP